MKYVRDYKVLPNRTVAPSVHFGLHTSETLHERLRSWYRNFRLASPGNDAPRFEEATRGSVVGSKSLSESLRSAFFERLRAPVTVHVGRGVTGIYGVHLDRGITQLPCKLHGHQV